MRSGPWESESNYGECSCALCFFPGLVLLTLWPTAKTRRLLPSACPALARISRLPIGIIWNICTQQADPGDTRWHQRVGIRSGLTALRVVLTHVTISGAVTRYNDETKWTTLNSNDFRSIIYECYIHCCASIQTAGLFTGGWIVGVAEVT